jgi:NhaP-type Na+/H+ or K+/H+ antiporter
LSTEEVKGRSLSQSVIYGLLLAILFLSSVLVVKELFVFVLAVAVAGGAWELSTALRQKNWHVARSRIIG